MSELITRPAIQNLRRMERLLTLMDADTYADRSTGPYYSSIGGHVRHVLDIFACVLDGVDRRVVDLTGRRRGTAAETDPEEALRYLERIVEGLEELAGLDPALPVTVVDDLANGKVEVPSTLGAGLCQAHSHAIHHYACIGYLLHLHGLELPDAHFGYNPTTPLTPTPAVS